MRALIVELSWAALAIVLMVAAIDSYPWLFGPIFSFLPTIFLLILFGNVLCDARRLTITYMLLFVPVLVVAPFTQDWGVFSLTSPMGSWAHDDPLYGFYSLAAVCFAGLLTQNGGANSRIVQHTKPDPTTCLPPDTQGNDVPRR